MQELGLDLVCEEIAEAFSKTNYTRVDQLLWPALDQFPQTPQLWFYAGNLNFNLGRVALADTCFQRCIDLEVNPLVLANLGAAKRRLNQHDDGIAVLKAALDKQPDYEPALINLGSMYVNEGCPELGIPYLEHARDIGEKKGRYERGCLWNLGLLYLEAGRFAEGFDIYRTGLGAERLMRTYAKDPADEPKILEPDSPTAGKTLIVWGEQGIGDELMAGTMIEEARKEFGEVIFECHPRLEKLHRMAHPGMRIYPTRKDDYIGWPVTDSIKADYKCPILDLAARYRRNLGSFTTKIEPTYRADEAEAATYRAQLQDIAKGRPIVALAMHGGVMQTARGYRTMRHQDAEHLFANTDCLFVGIDYDDMTSFTMHMHEKFGEHRYVWFPSIVQHYDYDHAAALLAACDMLVTVPQSIAHVGAGMGVRTVVLTPKRTAWREIVIPGLGDDWYWYAGGHAKLYQQQTHGDWLPVLERVIADIKELA